MKLRFALLLSAAALSTAPGFAQPVHYHAMTGAAHQVQADTLSGLGYRMISLSMCMASVWIPHP